MLDSYDKVKKRLQSKKPFTEMETCQLYRWYWGSNYSQSAAVQELRYQLYKRFDLERTKEA